MRIGIDFDNTIARYDQAFVSLARDWNLIVPDGFHTKIEVRAFLRKHEGGEKEWQRLQGRIYGSEIRRAELFDGVQSFFKKAQYNHVDLYIVSHKTELGHFDEDKVNLRDAARTWMKSHGFFEEVGYGPSIEKVFFLDTRKAKIEKIVELKLDWFIDDLSEIFLERNFPASTRAVLFNEVVPDGLPSAIEHKISWSEIESLIFQ